MLRFVGLPASEPAGMGSFWGQEKNLRRGINARFYARFMPRKLMFLGASAGS